MSIAASLIQELEAEAATTRRVLAQVPDAKLDWAPAPKTRTLGQLAMHVATNPGGTTRLISQNPVQLPSVPELVPQSSAELLEALDLSVAEAKERLQGMSDAQLMETWRMYVGDKEVFAMPRIAFLRAVFLNHWYHHRGQLSVYLRLLGATVPSIYGPSADENPFA